MKTFFLKLSRRRRMQQDLDNEIAFHREMAAASGNPVPFGNDAVMREHAYDQWRFTFIENLWRDLVYAARGLTRNPALVLSALLSLSLGVGANTTLFSLGLEFLFSQPSVSDASSLVYVRAGGNSHISDKGYQIVRESGLFRDVAGERDAFVNWNDGTETRSVFGVATTQNYFTALGIPVEYGRGYTSDDRKEVVVLQHQFWMKHFNGDLAVLGRALNLDGRACIVVGILPATHRTLTGYGYAPDVFLPAFLPNPQFAMYARVKPGMSLGETRAGMNIVAARLDREVPETWKYTDGTNVKPVAGWERLKAERDAMTIALFFVVLLVVAGLVLMIACINVASLLLARAAARRQEIAVRLALGASRARLLQQLLTESMLLSIIGAAAGVALSQFAARLLAAIHLPIPVPVRLQVTIDWRIFAYAALLTVFATLVAGLLPAWQSLKQSITPDLHRTARVRMRRTLVAAQVAVSVIVLFTGLLFLRNLQAARGMSPGFDLHHTLRAEVHLPAATYPTNASKQLYFDRAVQELEATPGIEAAAAARVIPFTDSNTWMVDIESPGHGKKSRVRFNWNAVTPNYFRAMEIPVLRGRAFNKDDRGATKVIIVNRTFVERYLDNRPAAGEVMIWKDLPYLIAGVVENTKNITIGEDPTGQLYEPLAQVENREEKIDFVARSVIPPASQIAPMRQTLRRIDPAAGVEVTTLYSSIGLAFLPSQVGAALMGSIGGIGLLLATVGIYGVMVYSVTQRTREIGVRMAIGARPRDIARMILMDSGRLIAIGSAIGLVIALFVAKPMAMFLVPGLSGSDPVTLAAVIVVLALAGLAATWGPMRRAVRIDPMTSLRYD